MFSKRKGFTLVELLIVIIVIGILAGGMMLASGSASDSAKASSLISELRNAKAAGIFWFADHIGSPDAEFATAWPQVGVMVPVFQMYMDNPDKATELVFAIGADAFGDIFLVGKAQQLPRVIRKATGQAQGLLLDGSGTVIPAGLPAAPMDVFIRVR